MTVPSHNQNQFTNLPCLKSEITITSPYLKKIQRRFALATILIPFLGAIIAVVMAFYLGIEQVEIVLLISLYTLTMIGITVGFHRHFAHCSFQSHPVMRVILAILGSMSAQGPLIQWVSIHRRHHKYSDRLEDPHSPHHYRGKPWGWIRGLWHGQVGWMLDSEPTNTILFAKDLLRDPAIAKVNQLYLTWVIFGLVIPTVLGGILHGSWIGAMQGFLWGGLLRIFLVNHAFWAINSLTHYYGNSPFQTHDQSRNNFWLALFNFGDAWHNNHHAYPNAAIVGFEWWQIDIAGWVIRLLEKVGLIWDLKEPIASNAKMKQ